MRTLHESQPCLFCKIVKGEAPSYKIYEDDKVVSFLDIRPVNRGHALVVPKEHFENIHDIPQQLLAHLHMVVKLVADAQKKAWSPAGIGVAQNNGQAAGQIIFHFHTHSIPKDKPDHARYEATPEDLERSEFELRKALEGL